MRCSYGKTKIFAENDLRDYLERKKIAVINSIESENDDYLLNVNELDYIKYNVDQARIDPIEIHEEQIYVSSSEQMIPAEYFPRAFNVYSGKSYKKDVIKFHIPFSGDADLLKCIPSRRIMWTMDVEISNNELSFEIINLSDDAESITRDKDSNIRNIMRQLENVTSEIARYN